MVTPATMTETNPNKSSSEEVVKDDRRCIQNKQNPFMIELVLENLFELCSWKTLLNCRLVCKTWKEVSFKHWRNKTALCFREKLDVEGNRASEEMMSTFGSHVILEDIKGKDEDLKLFLSNFQSLQVLDVRNCEWNGGLDISNVHLQQLKIHRNVKVGDDIDDMSGLESCSILKCFPNLTALSFEYRERRGGYLNPRAFECFVKNLNKHAKSNVVCLRELDLILDVPRAFEEGKFKCSHNVSQNFLKPIVECKLPYLERLDLELMWISDIDMKKAARLLLQLLCSCKEYLRYLRIFFRFETEEYIYFLFDEFQKNRPVRLISALTPVRGMKIMMAKLKEAELGNCVWGFFLLAHLELPNLKKLKMHKGESSDKVNIQPYQMKHIKDRIFPNLETFELYFTNQVPLPATMHTFEVMMPNLIHLSVPLDKDSFLIVCERFPRLRTLNVIDAVCCNRPCKTFMDTYSRLDDETLTGVLGDGSEGNPRPFNITNLTQLRNLTITSECLFTEHSVSHGFLQLSMLYNLKASFKKISDEAKTKLINHVRGTVDVEIVDKC